MASNESLGRNQRNYDNYIDCYNDTIIDKGLRDSLNPFYFGLILLLEIDLTVIWIIILKRLKTA